MALHVHQILETLPVAENRHRNQEVQPAGERKQQRANALSQPEQVWQVWQVENRGKEKLGVNQPRTPRSPVTQTARWPCFLVTARYSPTNAVPTPIIQRTSGYKTI